MGCILGWWSHYREKFNAPYSQADAISDAYTLGILKAIDKDRGAPTCAGKQIKCEHCRSMFQAPNEMPGDERANKIYAEAPANRVPTKRQIRVTCTKCDHDNIVVIEKVIFSTLVFPNIRAAIQRGVMRVCSKKGIVSIEGDEEHNLNNVLEANQEEHKSEVPEDIKVALEEAIGSLSERQRFVLAMFHGIGGIYHETIEREVTCPHCVRQYEYLEKKDQNKLKESGDTPTPFTVAVDYSVANNFIECPSCGLEVKIDMAMSQTDIAKHLSVSKQRICSTIKGIMSKLRGDVKEMDKDYCLWKEFSSNLTRLMYNYGIGETAPSPIISRMPDSFVLHPRYRLVENNED